MTRRALLASLFAPPGALEADGMLRIGGRRTFVHGLYQLPTGPNAWQRARDAGFQVVHRPATRAALDEAARNGMLAWCTTGFLSPEKRAADEKRIRDLVAALKRPSGAPGGKMRTSLRSPGRSRALHA
ncbi:MAG: hypothetical protein U0Q16_31945 [Bryobacteraceae bacterium]